MSLKLLAGLGMDFWIVVVLFQLKQMICKQPGSNFTNVQIMEAFNSLQVKLGYVFNLENIKSLVKTYKEFPFTDAQNKDARKRIEAFDKSLLYGEHYVPGEVVAGGAMSDIMVFNAAPMRTLQHVRDKEDYELLIELGKEREETFPKPGWTITAIKYNDNKKDKTGIPMTGGNMCGRYREHVNNLAVSSSTSSASSSSSSSSNYGVSVCNELNLDDVIPTKIGNNQQFDV